MEQQVRTNVSAIIESEKAREKKLKQELRKYRENKPKIWYLS